MLTGTTFWSFMREFPRDVLNWAPVRTVSPEQSPQTNVHAAEIAILPQFVQRRFQRCCLSRHSE